MGKVIEREYDMVMLNQAAVPQPDQNHMSSVLNVAQSPGGWFMEYHPKLRPMDSPTDGIFFAGACQGPKDIPASVAQGSAAASRASRILHSDSWQIEPTVAVVWPDRCVSAKGQACGICARACLTSYDYTKVGSRRITAKCHLWACGTMSARPRLRNCIYRRPGSAQSAPCWQRTERKSLHPLPVVLLRRGPCRHSHSGSANERGLRVMCSARMDAD